MTKKIDFAAYLEIEGVNWSTLKELHFKSALHYRHRLDNPREDTKALRKGRVNHTAVFEPERLLSEYVIFDHENKAGKIVKTGKVWDEFEATHADKTILTPSEYADAIAVRDAVRNHPLARPYLERGEAEKAITWRDQETGLACKSRLDFVSKSKPALVDLKSSANIEYGKFASTAYRLAYHCQLAFYDAGLIATESLDLPVVVIAVEQTPPYDVGVFEYNPDCLEAGRERVASLLTKLAYFREMNVWPGQYSEEQVLEFPSWATPDASDDLTDLGLET